MRAVLIALAVILGLIVATAAIGYAALRRGDIPYETLETRYGSDESMFLDLGEGIVLHYRDQGAPTGRPILLVHGYSASLHTWAAWETDLAAAGYRVVSIDLPGHGLTRTPAGYQPGPAAYADLVDQVAQKLGLGGVVLVGSSMGGHTAWTTALRHPARVDGLVLVAAAGFRDTASQGGGDPLIFRLIRNPIAGPILRDLDTTALTRQGLQRSFADPTLATEAMVDRYVDLSRAPEHRNVLLRLMTTRDPEAAASVDRLAAIAAPTLVMHGEKDNLVPFEHGRKFIDAIKGAESAFYADVGHIPQEEIPERSVSDLKAFLERHGLNAQGRPGAPLAGADPTSAAKPLEGVY
jgi:pimeloyl-ACP methyl ester carboxylesterase